MKKRISWTKYGGGRATQIEYDEDTHWYCQICTKKFDKEVPYNKLAIAKGVGESLKICDRCKKAVDNDKYETWEDIYTDYLETQKLVSTKDATSNLLKSLIEVANDAVMLNEPVVNLKFKALGRDRRGEYNIMVSFLEQLANGDLDRLTQTQLKDVAESILIRLVDI